MRKREKLSAKQQLFVEEYLVDGNAGQAAIRVGYTADWGWTLLRENAGVRQAVAERQEELVLRRRMIAERAFAQLERMAFLDPREVMTWGPDGVTLKPSEELAPETAACLEVSVHETAHGQLLRLKLPNRLPILQELARGLQEPLPITAPEPDPAADRDMTKEDIIHALRERLQRLGYDIIPYQPSDGSSTESADVEIDEDIPEWPHASHHVPASAPIDDWYPDTSPPLAGATSRHAFPYP